MFYQKDEQKGFTDATRTVYHLRDTLCHGRFILSLFKGSLFLCSQKRVPGEKTSHGLKPKSEVSLVVPDSSVKISHLRIGTLHMVCFE